MAYQAVVNGLDTLVLKNGVYSGNLTVEIHEIEKDKNEIITKDKVIISVDVQISNKDSLDFAKKWAIGEVKQLLFNIGQHLPVV